MEAGGGLLTRIVSLPCTSPRYRDCVRGSKSAHGGFLSTWLCVHEESRHRSIFISSSYLTFTDPFHFQLSVEYTCCARCKPWHQFLESEETCSLDILVELKRISQENISALDEEGIKDLLRDFVREKLDEDYFSNFRLKFM